MSAPLTPDDGTAARPGGPARLWARTEPVSALLVAGLCLTTVWPGRQLFEDGGWWSSAVWLVLLLVGVAALVRLVTGSALLGGVVQVVTAAVYLLRAQLGDTLAAGVVPTPATARQAADLLRSAGELLSQSAAPVPAAPGVTFALLTALALVTVLTDSAVHVVRSVVLAAVAPLLVFVVLAANRTTSEPWWWFLLLAAFWVGLLALHHTDEAASATGARGRGLLGAPGRGALLGTAAVLTAGGVATALVVPQVLPARDQQLSGRGLAGQTEMATVDFTDTLDLESDLSSDDERPVVLWHSSSDDPGPLRITATDRFRDDRWTPEEGREAQDVLQDPDAVDGAVADRLPHVDWADVLPAQEQDFAVTANGITAPFLATPSFPVDLRSPVAVTGDAQTDSVWVDETARHYEGAALDPKVPETMPRGQQAQEPSESALEVPEELAGTIEQVNGEVVDPQDAPLDKARAMQAWLRNGDFEYSLDAAEAKDGESMVEAFLREKRGYCTQYATTMILMARQQGIPARMAMGLLPGEETDEQLGKGSDVGPERRSLRKDAHAWPELYFEGIGWIRFEPTPSERAATVPDYSQPVGSDASASPSPSESEASPSPSPSASESEASPSPSSSDASPSASESQEDDAEEQEAGSGWWKVALLVLGLLLLAALALAWLPWRAGRARAAVREQEESPWSATWETLRLDLLDRGVSTRASDSVRSQARAVAAQRGDVDAAALTELAERTEGSRYARPDAEAAGDPTEATALRDRVLESLDASESGTSRLKRTLFPASASR
ncbi:transglutaminase TgpA family protein [Kytococcus sp. Marseille-QA3725]